MCFLPWVARKSIWGLRQRRSTRFTLNGRDPAISLIFVSFMVVRCNKSRAFDASVRKYLQMVAWPRCRNFPHSFIVVHCKISRAFFVWVTEYLQMLEWPSCVARNPEHLMPVSEISKCLKCIATTQIQKFPSFSCRLWSIFAAHSPWQQSVFQIWQ